MLYILAPIMASKGNPPVGMKKLTEYDFGQTPSRACARDQRFTYCLYVPITLRAHAPAACPLMLVIHGTDRVNQMMRDYFSETARTTGSVILAPLFPVGVGEPSDLDGYKYLSHCGIRYDLVVRSMIEEVASYYGMTFEKTVIFGFSGGAHFAHRYAYLYPESLSGVVVAAPGMVTLLDDTADIWSGTRNTDEKLGRRVDLTKLSQVPFQLLVGANDNAPHVVDVSPFGITGAHLNRIGPTRITRLQALRDNLRSHNIRADYREVPGAGHSFEPLADAAQAFLRSHLQ
jgi:pimeloyl-ACP methyl ester carboxylesterase